MNVFKMKEKTTYTMITWELKVDDCVLDGARTKEDAIEWVNMMNETKEEGDSIVFSFNPILIDDDNGEQITEDNIRIYLKPQFDSVYQKQMRCH